MKTRIYTGLLLTAAVILIPVLAIKMGVDFLVKTLGY